MIRRLRLLDAFPVLLAAALVLRLGGIARSVLPGAPALVLALVAIMVLPGAWRRGRAVDWRVFVRRHAFTMALSAIVLLTFAVRLPGLSSELGHTPLDIDEHRLAANVAHFFATGELLHDTVEHYPGAVFWLFSAASFFGYLHSLATGFIVGPTQIPIEIFMRSARIANVCVAAGIVLFTGLTARRLFGRTAGLLAALVVAIVPLSVDTTTAVRNDPGMVLAVMAAVYLALVSVDDPGSRSIAGAGVLAGVATGIKYSSVFAIVPAMLAAGFAGPKEERPKRTALALAGFVAAVLITNHFVWADFPNFLKQLADQVAITGSGHWAATDNPAAFYVMILDRFGPGWPLLVMAAGFAVYGLCSRNVGHLVFLSFPLLYIWFMTGRPSQFPRWVFPMVPFVAAAGAGVAAAVLRLPLARQNRAVGSLTMRAAVTAIVVAAFWPPVAAGAVSLSRRLTPPTHAMVEAWLRQHVPPGGTVVIEQHWLDLDDAPFTVRRVPDVRALLDEGIEPLAGAGWLVVAEPQFGHPALKRLGLVQRFHAGQGFGGSLGYDYEVYAVPRLPPSSSGV
jgi:4-amino-4-deoxy-L-arabinose transferase-like glycosyltransferase